MPALLASLPFIGPIFSFFSSGLLTSISAVAAVLMKGAIDLISWYLAEFWKGLGVILGNLSTLVVIITLILGASWYTKEYTQAKEKRICELMTPKKSPTKTKGVFRGD